MAVKTQQPSRSRQPWSRKRSSASQRSRGCASRPAAAAAANRIVFDKHRPPCQPLELLAGELDRCGAPFLQGFAEAWYGVLSLQNCKEQVPLTIATTC